jgi:hypothetical protein
MSLLNGIKCLKSQPPKTDRKDLSLVRIVIQLHPLAEVFGFRVDDASPEAARHRNKRLCPFNNRSPNCTKDKAEDPLGVCSVYDGNNAVITCPIRFRQNWIIADDAAEFFFSAQTKWTSLTEVTLDDRWGKSAGKIDLVLVAYDDGGQITDFGSLEVQAVYISGNVRNPFHYYMEDPAHRASMDWTKHRNYPHPDYLSSSRKRLAPQLLFKGGILHAWGKKQAVAVDRHFFATLPQFERIEKDRAELAWLVYDLHYDPSRNSYKLVLVEKAYTRFKQALERITVAEPGNIEDFVSRLQENLSRKLEGDPEMPPNPSSLQDLLGEDEP